jgi:hypothetical protein
VQVVSTGLIVSRILRELGNIKMSYSNYQNGRYRYVLELFIVFRNDTIMQYSIVELLSYYEYLRSLHMLLNMSRVRSHVCPLNSCTLHISELLDIVHVMKYIPEI